MWTLRKGALDVSILDRIAYVVIWPFYQLAMSLSRAVDRLDKKNAGPSR